MVRTGLSGKSRVTTSAIARCYAKLGEGVRDCPPAGVDRNRPKSLRDRTGREHLSRCRPQDLVQQQTAGHCGVERVEVILHGDAH
jgi:hypothetical protein